MSIAVRVPPVAIESWIGCLHKASTGSVRLALEISHVARSLQHLLRPAPLTDGDFCLPIPVLAIFGTMRVRGCDHKGNGPFKRIFWVKFDDPSFGIDLECCLVISTGYGIGYFCTWTIIIRFAFFTVRILSRKYGNGLHFLHMEVHHCVVDVLDEVRRVLVIWKNNNFIFNSFFKKDFT